MKKYLDGLKKRTQLVLLIANVILTCGNMIILSTKLESLNQRNIVYCQILNFSEMMCEKG
jgi:hypothetical protein